ncbi:MAG: hypothetical protein D3910_09010 [Candidatus Electrothrix sp. ATG2]|nr:hypothetical protein [Candidatus Electrothrix sp. ATG2]
MHEKVFIYIDILKRELDYLERLESPGDIAPAKRPVTLSYIDKLYFPWVRSVTHSHDKRSVPLAWSVHRLHGD